MNLLSKIKYAIHVHGSFATIWYLVGVVLHDAHAGYEPIKHAIVFSACTCPQQHVIMVSHILIPASMGWHDTSNFSAISISSCSDNILCIDD